MGRHSQNQYDQNKTLERVYLTLLRGGMYWVYPSLQCDEKWQCWNQYFLGNDKRMHTIQCVSFCQNGWILMIKSVDASAPKSVRINASCLERGYSEDSCTLQSLSHFLCYIFRILTNSGNWQSVTRIQYKQQQSLNFHKLALKSNSWKGNADAILENSMRILEVVRSEFWCDTGSGSLPFFLMFGLIWHSRVSTLVGIHLEIRSTDATWPAWEVLSAWHWYQPEKVSAPVWHTTSARQPLKLAQA